MKTTVDCWSIFTFQRGFLIFLIMRYQYSAHAIYEMERRSIARSTVDKVIKEPGQIIEEYDGLLCYQSKIEIDGKTYILRVMLETSHEIWTVITVYRTSKIEKYWHDL